MSTHREAYIMVNDLDKKCWICGREENLPFKCRFCGKVFCSLHRLPEQHACEGLDDLNKNGRFYGKRSGQGSSSDNMVKDVLKDTAKYAAKNAATGVGRNIGNSIKNSPSIAIIFICIISYLLQAVPGYFAYFMLIPNEIMMRPWTIITHMFLHVNLIHLFFNMLVLFFFGPELERRAGKKIFLVVYFTSGIVAAIGYSVTSSSLFIPMVGASGAILGVFAALAVIAPDIRVYVYFIPMKIVHALVLFAFIDFIFIGADDMIAHTAHLSGILVGVLMGMRIKRSQVKYGSYARTNRR